LIASVVDERIIWFVFFQVGNYFPSGLRIRRGGIGPHPLF
jgi:hypothetical protein